MRLIPLIDTFMDNNIIISVTSFVILTLILCFFLVNYAQFFIK